MPYKVEGKTVFHYIDGRWLVKEVTRSHENAIKALHLLEGIEHGWTPTHLRK